MIFELVKWNIGLKQDLVEAFKDVDMIKRLPERYPYPFGQDHAQHYIEQRLFNSEEKQICRAIVCDNRLIGGVEIIFDSGRYSRTGNLIVWITKDHRRKGVGSSAVKQICDIAFNDYNAARITAKSFRYDNITSLFLRNTGFILEGTIHSAIFENNNLYDYNIFCLLSPKL